LLNKGIITVILKIKSAQYALDNPINKDKKKVKIVIENDDISI